MLVCPEYKIESLNNKFGETFTLRGEYLGNLSLKLRSFERIFSYILQQQKRYREEIFLDDKVLK